MALQLPASAIPDIVELPKRSNRGPSKRADEPPVVDEDARANERLAPEPSDEASAEAPAREALADANGLADAPTGDHSSDACDAVDAEPRQVDDGTSQSLPDDAGEQIRGDDIVIAVDTEAEDLARTKTLRELRDMCTERGLSSAGKKTALVDRLLRST